MTDIIILPGIGGSGERHWQTIWERSDPSMRRFQPADWDAPDLGDWLNALDRAVAQSKTPPILVAHSLACLLVAHWSPRSALPVAGAFLVSVPDPEGPAFPRADAASFVDPPRQPLRFPSLVVASGNDPYGPVAWQMGRAKDWGSRFVDVGEHGHINAASGLDAWPVGRDLLDDFVAELQPDGSRHTKIA